MIPEEFYPMIQKALNRNGDPDVSTDDVLYGIQQGVADFLISETGKSLVVTHDTVEQGRLICNGWLLCGDLEDAMTQLIPQLMQQRPDVQIFRQEGSPGYQRFLRSLGYKTKRVRMEYVR